MHAAFLISAREILLWVANWKKKKKNTPIETNLKCCQTIWLTLHPFKIDFPCRGHPGSNKLGTRCLVGSRQNTEEISAASPSCQRTRQIMKELMHILHNPFLSPSWEETATAHWLAVEDRRPQHTTITNPPPPLISSHKIGFHGLKGYAEG